MAASDCVDGTTQNLYERLTDTFLCPEAIDECYEVLCELGRGGFGIVHLVRNKRTDILGAMKKLPCHPPKGPGNNEALRKEIKTILNLKSDKNIVSLLYPAQYVPPVGAAK